VCWRTNLRLSIIARGDKPGGMFRGRQAGATDKAILLKSLAESSMSDQDAARRTSQTSPGRY
jgi:hypothetical protein